MTGNMGIHRKGEMINSRTILQLDKLKYLLIISFGPIGFIPD
jgi:hypothetical protein